MQIHRTLPSNKILDNCALTVGTFDGVHRGHQTLVARLKREADARRIPCAALTFDDMPLCHFQPETCPPLLTLREEKIEAFAQTALDHLFIVPFDDSIAHKTYRDFMRLMCETIGLKLFVGGPDFALGAKREGTIPQLEILGEELGFEARALDEKLIAAGAPISSTRCRELIRIGEVELSREFLGRPYRMSGDVVSGQQLGRTIGVPTINFEPHSRKCVPPHGVYAIRARFVDETLWRDAALNIGVRPTVDGLKRQIEFHVLDESIDEAPVQVEIEFVARLRDERRFENLDLLVAQMKRDFEAARAILRNPASV